MRGGAAVARDPPSLPEQMARAARSPAQAPEGAGPTRGVRDARGTRGGCPGAAQAPAPPTRSGDTANGPRPAPPPPHTPHTDPGPAGGAARGPLPGRRGRGRRGRRSPAPECGPPGTRAPWGWGAAWPVEGAAGPRA